MPRGMVFQCGACRSLVTTSSVVGDKAQDRAGLSCDVCGAVTWLPFAAAGGARVVDVDVSAPPSAPAGLQLVATSTALAPMAPSGMTAAAFGEEQRARIRERLLKQAATGSAQEDLATSFERLLGQWHNEAEHRLFLQKASLVNELAFAGGRYRAILEEAPSDAGAKKAQKELLALAMASMSQQKDVDRPGTGSRAVLAVAVLVVTVVLCGAIVVYLPRLLRTDPEGGTMDPLSGEPMDGPSTPSGRPPVEPREER